MEDLTNRTFASILVKGANSDKPFFWDCQCICGKSLTVKGLKLKTGEVTSCGCIRGRNLIGETFSRLLVISFAYSRKTTKGIVNYWNCICSCGSDNIASSPNLFSGNNMTTKGTVGLQNPARAQVANREAYNYNRNIAKQHVNLPE